MPEMTKGCQMCTGLGLSPRVFSYVLWVRFANGTQHHSERRTEDTPMASRNLRTAITNGPLHNSQRLKVKEPVARFSAHSLETQSDSLKTDLDWWLVHHSTKCTTPTARGSFALAADQFLHAKWMGDQQPE